MKTEYSFTLSDAVAIHRTKSGFKAFVTNPQAASLINKRLRYFPVTTDFVRENSEAIFAFGVTDLAFVTAVLSKFGPQL